MRLLQGDAALSPFRTQRLLQQLHQQLERVEQSDLTINVIARTIYLVAVTDAFTLQAKVQLQRLLPGTITELDVTHERSGLNYWVVPRQGTQSPWSAKAKDIIEGCGIPGVVHIEQGIHYQFDPLCSTGIDRQFLQWLNAHLHDPLLQTVITQSSHLFRYFKSNIPLGELVTIPIDSVGKSALIAFNTSRALGLNEMEVNYLFAQYQAIGRNPTDAELMMFAQVNSEHCRHKVFNACWNINDEQRPSTLFAMIKATDQAAQAELGYAVQVAYHDNAAVMGRRETARGFWADPNTRQYHYHEEADQLVFKVETHNHPTAISPHPGAATGSGGEIRDEGATGRGATTKAGLVGFSVSDLHIPGLPQPWEAATPNKPKHFASALSIMLDAPIGAAAYNNEFGRPNVLGYFRSFQVLSLPITGTSQTEWGYHKPILLAGGVGRIRQSAVHKAHLVAGTPLVVLGGPAMAIGLGGGSASSQASTSTHAALDFASVQRANPEMERRCQSVIDTCWALGPANPILSIHDVGAGGLSNALPELVAASDCGATIALRDIPNAEPSMSPLEIWCNEAQERYVLAIDPQQLATFEAIATRERCPAVVVGEATTDNRLRVTDVWSSDSVIDLPMAVLMHEMPRQQRHDYTLNHDYPQLALSDVALSVALSRVLRHPTVADKTFLVTIGDRSVGGLVARDQCVGPWQVPVADVAVTCADYLGYRGEAMSIGERPPLACFNPVASARMAVGEALTNLAAANITQLSQVIFSANWMVAAHESGQGAALYDAVKALTDLCIELGISVPVGKDSTSMHCEWRVGRVTHQMIAPLSPVISALGLVSDVRRTLTPVCDVEQAASSQLLFIDLADGQHRLTGSILAQCYQALAHDAVPDLVSVSRLQSFMTAMQALHEADYLLAYHDRSDGGLIATLCEMMFASHCGLDVSLSALGLCMTDSHSAILAALFNEELGAVIQVADAQQAEVMAIFERYQLSDHVHPIARINATDTLRIMDQDAVYFTAKRVHLQCQWSEVSHRLQALRDDPSCAHSAYEQLSNTQSIGLSAHVTFDWTDKIAVSASPHLATRPQVAILREQGVNGHLEMAAAFHAAGFTTVDVHMSDLLSGQSRLDDFAGLAACGGFSYGDVLGAGRGWAQSIRMHDDIGELFQAFFNREDRFVLGICNGCQLLSALHDIIPGVTNWPTFQRNVSEQYEARVVMTEILPSRSIFFKEMAGAVLPVVVAHGEGQAVWSEPSPVAHNHQQCCLRYVDDQHQATMTYPANPNGSPGGLTGFCNEDGRITIMMPHPERVIRPVQLSWSPRAWQSRRYTPWIKLFNNAYAFATQL